MSFILGTMNPTEINGFESRQVRCSNGATWDKIAAPAALVRQCRRCRQHFEQSAFASKGRDRPSAFCKSCDNKRRRAAYNPKFVAPDWDHVIVHYEVAAASAEHTAPLLWEMLIEQQLWVGAKAKEEETLDSLLNRRSAIDGIITEV
ncbi:MAG: hypothetical protein K2Q26_02710 [Bdellovibrionales bacterium]|nr:hypothetical protein [Bdellovibrionales bacterium]